jgi:hypothetical protein
MLDTGRRACLGYGRPEAESVSGMANMGKSRFNYPICENLPTLKNTLLLATRCETL